MSESMLVPTHERRVEIESSRLDGAEVVAPSATGVQPSHQSYGEGTGVLISSYPSLAYNSSADPDTASSVVALLDGGNAISRVLDDADARARVAARVFADGRQLVFAINWATNGSPGEGRGWRASRQYLGWWEHHGSSAAKSACCWWFPGRSGVRETDFFWLE